MSRLLTAAARQRPSSLAVRAIQPGSGITAAAGVVVGGQPNGSSLRPFHSTPLGFAPPEGFDAPRRQKFVQEQFSATMWDPAFKNPMWRPKYNGRAKILSSDDYKRRPKTGFSVNFANLADTGIVLSWMTHKEQKTIFEEYKTFLRIGWEKYHVTSHEYVIREIASRRNLAPERVAGVVQLQFNEAKYRIDGTTEICEDIGEYMDNCFLTEIRRCYKAYGMNPPTDLSVVDWKAADGVPKEESLRAVEVSDIFDLDEAWKKFENEYLPEKAKKIIAKHQFLEDVYDETVKMPLDEETLEFMERQKKFAEKAKKFETEDTPESIRQKDTAEKNYGRKRWNYVAKMVNTRALKEKRRKANEKPILGWKEPLTRNLMPTSYNNDNVDNTVVEIDGHLRQATLADVKNVAWKPRRYRGDENTLEESVAIQEKMYREAKLDWLNYIHGRPHTGVFGQDENAMIPVVQEPKKEDSDDASLRLLAEEEGEVDVDDQDDGDDADVEPLVRDPNELDEDGNPPKL